MLNTILIVGFGGFLGAVFRMVFVDLINKFLPHSINLGTLFVNILGSFFWEFCILTCKISIFHPF